MDRDAKFSEAFRVILEQAGVKAVRLPPRSPNLNPNLERFMRSVKEECLHRMIFFAERSLQVAAAEFLSHFHTERNHQGLGNRLIEPGVEVGRTAGDVACREPLGGMLRTTTDKRPDLPAQKSRRALCRIAACCVCRSLFPFLLLSGEADIVPGHRWKPRFRSIAVDRNRASLPTPTVEESRSCRTSEFLDLTP